MRTAEADAEAAAGTGAVFRDRCRDRSRASDPRQAQRPELQSDWTVCWTGSPSGTWMEKAPGDGPDFVEGRQRPVSLVGVDDTGEGEEPQVAVDLLG